MSLDNVSFKEKVMSVTNIPKYLFNFLFLFNQVPLPKYIHLQCHITINQGQKIAHYDIYVFKSKYI